MLKAEDLLKSKVSILNLNFGQTKLTPYIFRAKSSRAPEFLANNSKVPNLLLTSNYIRKQQSIPRRRFVCYLKIDSNYQEDLTCKSKHYFSSGRNESILSNPIFTAKDSNYPGYSGSFSGRVRIFSV